MNKMRVKTLCVLMLVLVLVVAPGCKRGGKVIDPNLTQGDGPTTSEGTGGPELPGIDQESILFGPSGLQKVYFDYDSFALRPDAIGTLNDNAAKIKQAPDVLIQIEGHCDERGTQEYNLALGEKRALAVRDYLMTLGIGGNRLVTISYGEERAAVEGSDESAWKFNRRCEFNKAINK
jgi:peptidoglycan-associated lipoprotein